MKECNFFRMCELCLMVIVTVFALVYLIYGWLIEGKPHCFFLSAMIFILDAVWYYDDKQKRMGDDYGRK